VPAPLAYFLRDGVPIVDIVVCTMSFAMGGVDPESAALSEWSADVLKRLGVPVLQAIAASSTRAQWLASMRGLTPLDTAMTIAVTAFYARIATVPVSFKARSSTPGASSVRYQPEAERIERLIAQVQRRAALRRKPNAEKRIAFVLTNQSGRASRIGNAVG